MKPDRVFLCLLFTLITLAMAAPAWADYPAGNWPWQPSQGIRPLAVVNVGANSGIGFDTIPLVYSDSFIIDTGLTVQLLSDTPTLFGDTYYQTDGLGYDTDVTGYSTLYLQSVDTNVVVNFTRPPIDESDGYCLAAGTSYRFEIGARVLFARTASGTQAAHPSCLRVLKVR